jgi:GNAT superfamily N-acetyltransferase
LHDNAVTNARFAIRQAQESDRAQIGMLVAETGSGPDPGGDCYVATVENRVVGAVTLIQLGDEEWWLDGLRVLPNFQGRGIGRALLQYAVQRAEAQSSGILRLAVDPRHPIMHRLAVQAQFSLAGSYLAYQTDGLPGYRPEFSLAPDIGAVRAFLGRSPHYASAERSVEDAGIWCRLTDARLQDYAAQSRVYVWHGQRQDRNVPDDVIGVIIYAANAAPPLLRLAYLDAAVGALADLCRAVRRLAAAQGYQRIQYRFLSRPERLVAIEQAGWRPPGTGGEDRDLFSRPLDIAQNRLIDP